MTKKILNSSLANKPKSIDYLVVILLPIFTFAVTLACHASFLFSTVFFFLIPTIYLLYRRRDMLKKVLVTALVSIPFGLVIDYFAMRDGAWYDSSLFSIRFLNGIPLEDPLWFAAWLSYVVAFYEYFIDRPKKGESNKVNPRANTLVGGWFVVLAVFAVAYAIFGTQLYIPYFYSFFGIVLGIIPLALVLSRYPKLIQKCGLVLTYFFPVHILHELSALATNQWIYPGDNFFGWVQFLQFRLPLEELLFWIISGSVFAVVWYEYFVDDTK